MQFQAWTFKVMKDQKFAQLSSTDSFLLTFHPLSFEPPFPFLFFHLSISPQHALLLLVMFLQIIFNDLSSLESANSNHRLRLKQEKAP